MGVMEQAKQLPVWVWLLLGFLGGYVVYDLYLAQPQQPAAPVQQPSQPAQAQPAQVVVNLPPKTYEQATFAIYVMDQEAQALNGTTVQLWFVKNATEVINKAFYADPNAYSVYASQVTDSLGVARFTIDAGIYKAYVLDRPDIKFYAVALPSADYYRGGIEIPTIELAEDGNFKKSVYSYTITVDKIARYYDTYNPKIEMRGLQAGDEGTEEPSILHVASTEKGLFKVYKVVVEPTDALQNATAFIDKMTFTVAGKTVDLIKDGVVELKGNETVEFPVIKLGANSDFRVTIYYKLSDAPDAALDEQTVAVLHIYDVRDQEIAAVNVQLNTA